MSDQSETQDSITKWADESFGKATLKASYWRFMKELNEFQGQIQVAKDENFGQEAADVIITFYRVCSAGGINLNDEVNKKMIVNRQRKWKLAGDGTAQHIKESDNV